MNKEIITIPTTNGYVKIYTKQIKYINIEERSMCYHLINGTRIESQKLRTSFEEMVSKKIKNDNNFIYLKPALIFNLNEIKAIDKYKVIFEDNEIYYFPKCKYDMLLKTWLEFNE